MASKRKRDYNPKPRKGQSVGVLDVIVHRDRRVERRVDAKRMVREAMLNES